MLRRRIVSTIYLPGIEHSLIETQIPKLGNRRRARPRFIGLLRREKSRSSWQLFCSVRVTLRYQNSLEDGDEHEDEDDFSTSNQPVVSLIPRLSQLL